MDVLNVNDIDAFDLRHLKMCRIVFLIDIDIVTTQYFKHTTIAGTQTLVLWHSFYIKVYKHL